jgi:hypothetical protein
MTPHPDFGYDQAATELVRGIVDAVADLPGLTEAQRFMKQQTTISSVMGFEPNDLPQVMLAGHCVMFDALLRDGVRDLLHGQREDVKPRSRSGNIASGRMFLSSLHTLARLQKREGTRTGVAQSATEPKIETAPPAAPPSPPRPVVVPAQDYQLTAKIPAHDRSRRFEGVSRGAMMVALAPPTGPVIGKRLGTAAMEPAVDVELFRQSNQSHAAEHGLPLKAAELAGMRMDQQDFRFVTQVNQASGNRTG